MSVATTQETQRPWQRAQGLLLQNPVTIKELRSRMRGRRAFVVLTLYLLAMGSLISLVYLAFAASAGPGVAARTAGKAVFGAVLGVQVVLVLFVGPAFTAGAITGEKERQTYELLRTTLLSPGAFVLGKLLSSLSYVLLLIVASIPLQSIAFLLGGLSLSELIVSQLLVVVAAVAYAMFGLYCSGMLRTTLAASVTTFVIAIFVNIGLPLLAFLFAALLGTAAFTTSTLFEVLVQYLVLIFAATNLPVTLIASELILLQEGTLFFFQSAAPASLWLFSPWLLFVLLHLLATVLLFIATVQRVARIAER